MVSPDSSAAVAAIRDERDAEALLELRGSPTLLREVARRADELKFRDPGLAVGVAAAAVKASSRWAQDRALLAFVWSTYGSALRGVARLDEAEAALLTAARLVPSGDEESRAWVAHRLAFIRAEQRRPEAARLLLPVFLDWGERAGGRKYGLQLLGAGAILITMSDFEGAAPFAEKALAHLPRNGDRYHLSAVYNLARCRLELEVSPADLDAAVRLVRETGRFAEPGTYPELKLHWLRGLLLMRLGRHDESLTALLTAQEGIDARPNGLDQALIMIDLAELHLERGDPEAARRLALSSFPILKLLRTNPEAYRALQTFHRAAQEQVLDSAAIAAVRDRLGAS